MRTPGDVPEPPPALNPPPVASWHFIDRGITNGPATLAALVDSSRAGRLSTETLVWCDGMPEWTPAGGSRASSTRWCLDTRSASSLPSPILRTRIVGIERVRIPYRQSLARAANVWFSGLAMSIPLIVIMTEVYQYRKLVGNGATSCDRGRPWRVLHAPLSRARVVVAWLVGIVMVVVSVYGEAQA